MYYYDKEQKVIISGNCPTTKLVANILDVRCVFKIRLTLVEITSIFTSQTAVEKTREILTGTARFDENKREKQRKVLTERPRK